MSAPAVRFEGNLAVLDFTPPWSPDSYARFLDVKRLPESRVAFHEETDTYRVTTPARFAHLLGSDAPPLRLGDHLAYPHHLWDYQRYGLAEALEAKRWAAWWDCGMGKSALEWEFAFQVAGALTGGRVLILTLNEVVPELVRLAGEWYGGQPPCRIRQIASRAELVRWARGDFGDAPEVGITNYEKLIPGPIPEFRHLAGIVADESSILKTGGGTIKWNLIHSARGIEYKLSATGTPAPNEAMEYASQGSFLERLRSEGEIVWTFFSKDRDGEWYIKPHAREAFHRWLSTWSMYLRNPSVYGFRDNVQKIPEPIYLPHEVPATGAQLRLARSLERHAEAAQGDLLSEKRRSLGVVERGRLSQAARGFIYHDERCKGGWDRVDSLKPQHVADLVRREAGFGQVICWTDFNAEVEILRDMLAGEPIELGFIGGDTPKPRRTAIIRDFQNGNLQGLVSKHSLIGFGLNLQMATAHVGSPTDSFERFYQRTRRSYRYGQKSRLRVHLPYVPELEGAILENQQAKERQFEADSLEQQRFYAAQMRERIAA